MKTKYRFQNNRFRVHHRFIVHQNEDENPKYRYQTLNIDFKTTNLGFIIDFPKYLQTLNIVFQNENENLKSHTKMKMKTLEDEDLEIENNGIVPSDLEIGPSNIEM